jgi:S1-C subfamily serine protease
LAQVPGNTLDVLLVVAGLLFALSGYRQGFVVGALSFVGFLGGGVLGARVAPEVAALEPLVPYSRSAVGLAVVLLAATVGQVLASVLGAALRRRLTWRPARQLDALGGAAVSVVSLLLLAWLVGRAVASSPYASLASQVRRSVVITTVDGVVPDAGRRFLADFRDLVDERDFPEVFSELHAVDDDDVRPPDRALSQSEVVQRLEASVLKVTGVAEDCRRRVEGSGFVYADDRVMTNAHVVAGVREPEVEVEGRQLPARVVLFDPARDVAVLAVDGLDLPALPVAPEPAEPGDDAVVLGYPEDGPFRPDAARVIRAQEARGEDIYQSETVVRDIYAVKGLVRPGNSGGPLVDPQGRVLGLVFAAAADDRTVGYVLTWEEVAGAAREGVARSEGVSTRTCG